MTTPRALRFDVTEDLNDGEPAVLAAWLFSPEPQNVAAVLCCFSGGTYDKRYWHARVAGYADYSFAEHLVAQGFAVIAIDHLGIGESTRPVSADSVRLRDLAAADAAVVRQIRRGLVEGTLHGDLSPMSGIPVIGIGHSMGAALTIMAQADSVAFDAIAVLGFPVDVPNVLAPGDLPQDLDSRLAISEAGVRSVSQATWDDGYIMMDRHALRPIFYASDVPAAVIAADDARQARTPKWCLVEVATAGFVQADARKVDVPVLIVFGEFDTVHEPRREPAFYTASQQISLFMLQGSAHCHNFASARTQLWDHIATWARGIRPRFQSV